MVFIFPIILYCLSIWISSSQCHPPLQGRHRDSCEFLSSYITSSEALPHTMEGSRTISYRLHDTAHGPQVNPASLSLPIRDALNRPHFVSCRVSFSFSPQQQLSYLFHKRSFRSHSRDLSLALNSLSSSTLLPSNRSEEQPCLSLCVACSHPPRSSATPLKRTPATPTSVRSAMRQL